MNSATGSGRGKFRGIAKEVYTFEQNISPVTQNKLVGFWIWRGRFESLGRFVLKIQCRLCGTNINLISKCVKLWVNFWGQ